MSSQSDTKKTPVVFEVEIESTCPRSQVPEKFKKFQKKERSANELLLKQEQAEERRKAYEKARLQRIKEKSEECQKINSKVEVLLAQDAKRQGMPGTEHIKPMSSRAAAHAIKSLSKDLTKITSSMTADQFPS